MTKRHAPMRQEAATVVREELSMMDDTPRRSAAPRRPSPQRPRNSRDRILAAYRLGRASSQAGSAAVEGDEHAVDEYTAPNVPIVTAFEITKACEARRDAMHAEAERLRLSHLMMAASMGVVA